MAEKIGDVLVRIGAMTNEQVAEVLRTQESGDKRIFGEIAIELGYVNDEALQRYVEIVHQQKKPR